MPNSPEQHSSNELSTNNENMYQLRSQYELTKKQFALGLLIHKEKKLVKELKAEEWYKGLEKGGPIEKRFTLFLDLQREKYKEEGLKYALQMGNTSNLSIEEAEIKYIHTIQPLTTTPRTYEETKKAFFITKDRVNALYADAYIFGIENHTQFHYLADDISGTKANALGKLCISGKLEAINFVLDSSNPNNEIARTVQETQKHPRKDIFRL